LILFLQQVSVMTQIILNPPTFDPGARLPPIEVEGHSKRLFALDDDHYLVELIPSLSSFTFGRYELMPGTEVLRLDFYELAAQRLRRAGLRTAFVERVGPNRYVARRCVSPPFETIVKNVATGSTTRKYPGLFPEGHRFDPPIVKFDYRIDPEDQPIADDYVRASGYCPETLKAIALSVNTRLRAWLAPADLRDFCLIIGHDADGCETILSEISPDCMRLRDADGAALDKDLFRQGASRAAILAAWTRLVADVRARGET
jgi:phosphoribosylaminoimidazole-succinocarboxamide synthase